MTTPLGVCLATALHPIRGGLCNVIGLLKASKCLNSYITDSIVCLYLLFVSLRRWSMELVGRCIRADYTFECAHTPKLGLSMDRPIR